jgi:hypothetical protein
VSGWQRCISRYVVSAACFASAAAACTSAWNQSGPPPFTAAETNDALEPVKALERRCYDGSESQRNKQKVHLEYVLYIDAQGGVNSDPVAGDFVPPLIDCMRTGLDSLKFPAKGVADQLHLSVQLGQ